MGGSLAQTDIARYHGVEHHIAEVTFQLFIYLIGKAQAGVIHGKQKTLYLKPGVEFGLYYADCVYELGDAFEREVITECAAVSAFTVIRPSEGEQSISM